MRLIDIGQSFLGGQAFKGMDLDRKRGEDYALMGENGAGNSTFMKIIIDIYTRDNGKMLLEGTLKNIWTTSLLVRLQSTYSPRNTYS